MRKASVTSEYCPSAWQCQASYTQLDLQLFVAVHLIRSGSVPILRLLFYLSLNPWEAPGWQVIAIDADVKQGITSWLQKLDNSVFILQYKLCYHYGANAKMVVVTMLRWCVTSAAHVPCIGQSHNIILTWECLLLYFFKVLCIYIAVWASEFINAGCSEWWGSCVICW